MYKKPCCWPYECSETKKSPDKAKKSTQKKNHIHRPVDSQTPARAAPAARVIVVPETATNSQKSAP